MHEPAAPWLLSVGVERERERFMWSTCSPETRERRRCSGARSTDRRSPTASTDFTWAREGGERVEPGVGFKPGQPKGELRGGKAEEDVHG